LALRVIARDVDQTREQERLAQALAAMRGPRAGRAEPAQAAVVAVVRGERAVRTVLQRDVHRRRIAAERARDLERPRATELARDRVEQRRLVRLRAANR